MDPTVPDAFVTYRGKTISPVKSVAALLLAVIGLATAVASAFLTLPATAALFIDSISLGASVWGLSEAAQDPAKFLFGKITVVLNAIAVALSTASLLGHIDKAARGE